MERGLDTSSEIVLIVLGIIEAVSSQNIHPGFSALTWEKLPESLTSTRERSESNISEQHV